MQLRALVVVALTLLSWRSSAQVPDSTRRVPGATVSGVVRDSVARAPLVGAWVQLVSTDSLAKYGRTTVSDSLGRFTLDNVPDGRYTLGFFHPLLDSLGVEPLLRSVSVDRHRPVRADLATPSPARLRAAICGGQSVTVAAITSTAVGAVVVGVVRDARGGAPVAGVKVTGEWLEISIRPGGVDRRRPRLVVTTGENGWFALCNVPSGGTMFLGAERGPESTDLIEVLVPAEGFVRRELYLGLARAVIVADSTPRPDTLAPPRRLLRIGDGRLRGTVVAVDGNRRLAGAQVRISDGLLSRADEQGEWMLTDAPTGTRVLEVRAVGYYPVRRSVDVITDAAPVRVPLSTFTAVLETVRITAERAADRHQSGFTDRRRSGLGRFLTAEDVVRRGVIVTSELFKNLPGVRMERDSTGDLRIAIRSAYGDYCEPSIYVDGMYFPVTAADLDAMVSTKQIMGIEVHTETSLPMAYQRALTGCGGILIWRK